MAPSRAPAVAALAVEALAVVTAWLGAAAVALADSPAPSQAAIGDPRSSGQGPGLAGDPAFAIALVALIAVASIAATLAWVRATGGPRDPDAEP